ncbi:hypothetical protein RI367_004370 [Sorochytrium milnesiophthora]
MLYSVLALLVTALVTMVVAAPTDPHQGPTYPSPFTCLEYGFLVPIWTVTGRPQAAQLCNGLTGYKLAQITNDNFLYARAALFDCKGPNKSAWIDSYYGNNYAPQCAEMTSGSTRDQPQSRLKAATSPPPTLGGIDCNQELPVICMQK